MKIMSRYVEGQKEVAQAEKKGRDKIYTLISGDTKVVRHYFTPEQFNEIDLFLTAATPEEKYAIEIKDRNFPTGYFPTGWIIETSKFKALINAYQDSGYTPYYANFFTDNKLVLWNLLKTPYGKEIMTTTKTTVFDRDKEKVTKERYLLKEEDAERIIDLTDYGMQ